jgi:hypothetical protein
MISIGFTHTRWSRLAVLVAVALLAPWLFPGRAAAFSIGTCPSTGQYHDFAHQYVGGSYYGQYGWFVTYNVSVPRPNTAFSLSHLYSYYGSSDPTQAYTWVEVGYYKGYGPQLVVTTPHYYYAWSDAGTYHEVDSSKTPSVGSTRVYEVEFQGHNYTLGTDDWYVYWDGFDIADGKIHLSSMPSSNALAGAEVQSDSSSWTQVQMHATPDQEVIRSNYTWPSWTSSNFPATAACQSTGLTLTETTKFTNFSASGQE